MVPHIALNQQRPRQFPVATDFDMMIGNPATSSLAAKFYNEEQLRHSMGYNPNLWFCYANNMNPFNSAVSSSRYFADMFSLSYILMYCLFPIPQVV